MAGRGEDDPGETRAWRERGKNISILDTMHFVRSATPFNEGYDAGLNPATRTHPSIWCILVSELEHHKDAHEVVGASDIKPSFCGHGGAEDPHRDLGQGGESCGLSVVGMREKMPEYRMRTLFYSSA